MRRTLCTILAVVWATTGFGAHVWAQSEVRPTIHNVTLDEGAGVLTITGVGFGRDPVVTVDGQPAVVWQGGSETQLMVLAPAALLTTPGSYRLTVVDPVRQLGDAFVVATSSVASSVANAPVISGAVSRAAELAGSLVFGGAVTTAISPSLGAPSPQSVIEDSGNQYRTALGFQALFANTTGISNVAVGYRALFANTSGYQNTANGHATLIRNTTGFNNTASGYRALQTNTTGSYNTVSGARALFSNTEGGVNTASGYEALYSNTTGTSNTASGEDALSLNTTGSYNVAVGKSAGRLATTGSNNIYLGTNVAGVAGESNAMYLGLQGTQTKTVVAGIRGTTVTGGETVVIDASGQLGSGPIPADSIGSAQVVDDSLTASDLAANAVGTAELADDAVTAAKAAFNYAASTSRGGPASDVDCSGCVSAIEVSFSYASLGANDFTDTQTIGTGNLNLVSSTATSGNITKGGVRFLHNFGSQNTFLGENAGNFTMTGGSNTASGNEALFSNTMGVANTASGYLALHANTTGNGNTASGARTLENNATGSFNIAVGANALFWNTAGLGNTAIGNSVLEQNTTADFNSAYGFGALAGNTTGNSNTASGSLALATNVSGYNNTAIGANSLSDNTTGYFNLAVGNAAGAGVATGFNNIYLGSAAGAADESNTMYLGTDGLQTRTFVAGIRGTTTAFDDAIPVVISSAGQLGTVSSSRRFKEDIHDMGDASAGILRLRPVTFRYTQAFAGGAKPRQYGLIAEEVAEVYPDLVVHSADGQVETVQYDKVNAMLLNEVQKQAAQIRALTDQLAALAARLQGIETKR